MTGKTDEIVTYVQQQADRLANMIDAKRGSLVDAIGSKTASSRSTSTASPLTALKSIETRGHAFSADHDGQRLRSGPHHQLGKRDGDRRGQQVAQGPEQSSRAAIDQSRQVSIAAVTEMQETSKILRTDTVALFERLREGNILLQEVLTGAHDNLTRSSGRW